MLNYKIEVNTVNSLLEFITSEEMIIVGVIILTASILTLIVFLIEKNYYKRKSQKALLNESLVEETQELAPADNQIIEVLPVSSTTNDDNLIETLDFEENKDDIPLVIPIEEFNEENALKISQEAKDLSLSPEKENGSIESIFNEVKDEVEQLQYTNLEPNEEEAKEELKRVTEELRKQEQEENIINLTEFEEFQEENAIISLDELMQKSEVLYQQNEVTQYQDEGNEPISLEDLEKRMKNIKIDIEEINKEEKQKETVAPIEEFKQNIIIENSKVKLDDLNTITDSKKAYREDVIFKSSPIISPIFGIEESKNENNLALENTANYDKLDEEIKKTNQFIATLKELQKKLD